MNYVKKQKINILLIMCLGFIVLITGVYIFTEVSALNKEIDDAGLARSLSRKILVVRTVHYRLESETFQYYFDPSEYNLSHYSKMMMEAENTWNDFSLSAKQSKDRMYEGADKDIDAISAVIERLRLGNKQCLDQFVRGAESGTPLTTSEVWSCLKDMPQDELDGMITSFSERQVAFVDKINGRVVQGLDYVGVFMTFLMGFYAVLLLVIISWIRHLNRWL